MSNVLTTCRSITELTEQAQKACNLFVDKCRAGGLQVLITETYRSQARQDYLYSQGRTRPGNKVTWTKNSRHTSRRAWDICKNIKGQEYTDEEFFKKCGAIAESLGIIWGGNWKSPDMPHFEVDTDWKYEGDDIDMEEFEKFKEQYEVYVRHTTLIINTIGKEIQDMKNIINLMGKELEELRK